jgi:hypothetical protein
MQCDDDVTLFLQQAALANRVVKKSRLPHFLDNRLTDGGKVVSLTRQPAALYPQEDFWYSFRLEAESPLG